jgi:hypothetical protein
MPCRSVSVPVYGKIIFTEDGNVKHIGLTQQVETIFFAGNPVAAPEIKGGEELAVGLAKEILKKNLGELPEHLEWKAKPSTWSNYQPAFVVYFEW